MNATLLHGDCIALMREMPDNSVDSIVCDPPYGLGFMGKKWDAPGLEWAHEWAAECLRVLKPGGHLVAFGGTRTVHRLAVAIEDGGFEIRDTVHWCYFSGFPKSLDVSKAMDKAAGAEREVVGRKGGRYDHAAPGHTSSPLGVVGGGVGDWESAGDITAPTTPEAIQWNGWGTALKPAVEPAILARKPLIGTVAANVLAHGTGGLNVDGCRIAHGSREWPGPQEDEPSTHAASDEARAGSYSGMKASTHGQTPGQQLGRWPANLYHCPKASRSEREAGCEHLPPMAGHEAVDRAEGSPGTQNPRAGAGRTAKEVRNSHPTVKPVALMRWLCRLVTPPGGVVLDTFMGSGTTGVACAAEGFDFIGCEREEAFMVIATARIEHVWTGSLDAPEWASVPRVQPGLFGRAS